VGFNSQKRLNLTNVYPNNTKNKSNNKVKSKPLELYDLAGKNSRSSREQTFCYFPPPPPPFHRKLSHYV
jgi:hypothetical protein